MHLLEARMLNSSKEYAMKYFSTAIALLLVNAIMFVAGCDKGPDDLSKMQGVWYLASTQGRYEHILSVCGAKLTITGGQYEIQLGKAYYVGSDARYEVHGDFTVNDRTNPKQMRLAGFNGFLKGNRDGVVVPEGPTLAIYDMPNNTLRVCVNHAPQENVSSSPNKLEPIDHVDVFTFTRENHSRPQEAPTHKDTPNPAPYLRNFHG